MVARLKVFYRNLNYMEMEIEIIANMFLSFSIVFCWQKRPLLWLNLSHAHLLTKKEEEEEEESSRESSEWNERGAAADKLF